MPARRLEGIAPVMKNKGRICVGADADITIFDPEQIIDQATYEEPAKYSKGIVYVLVNGVVVVNKGQLQNGIFPGKQSGVLLNDFPGPFPDHIPSVCYEKAFLHITDHFLKPFHHISKSLDIFRARVAKRPHKFISPVYLLFR